MSVRRRRHTSMSAPESAYRRRLFKPVSPKPRRKQAVATSVQLGARGVALAFVLDPSEVQRFLAKRPIRMPRPHQVSGAEFIVKRLCGELPPAHLRGGGLFDDMRMGKCQTITMAILEILQRDVSLGKQRFGRPFLIVCPKDVLSVWVREIHATLGKDTLQIFAVDTEDVPSLHESVVKRKLRDETDVIVTTSSMLSRADNFLVDHLKNDLSYRALFADEAHKMQNEETLAFQTMTALPAASKWFISGTPIQNTLDSLVSALRFMGVPDSDIPSHDARELTEFARQLTLRRSMEDVKTPIPRQWIDFTTPLERQLYTHVYDTLNRHKTARMERLQFISLLRCYCLSPYLCPVFAQGLVQVPSNVIFLDDDDMETDDVEATARRALARQMRCEAIGAPFEEAVSPQVWQRMRAIRPRVMPQVSAKEQWICRSLLSGHTDANGEKVVIFSTRLATLERLRALLDFRLQMRVPGARGYAYVVGQTPKEERESERARFEADPHCGVLLAIMEVNNVGIDYTCANHCVLLDPWWNPTQEFQAINRLKGPKQTREVHLYRLLMRGTIENNVANTADEKLVMEQAALPATYMEEETRDINSVFSQLL